MESAFTLLSDKSEALNGKLYVVGGGWNLLSFPTLPQQFGFSIGLGIDVSWNETNQRHRLQVSVENPDGERLGDPFALEFETGRPPGAVQGQDQRLVMSLDTEQVFQMHGPHAVVVSVNDDEIGRSRFQVIRVPSPTAAT